MYIVCGVKKQRNAEQSQINLYVYMCVLARVRCLQAALLLCGSMSGALPVAAAAYMAVCFVWLNATMGLARDMSGPEEGKMVRPCTHTSQSLTGCLRQVAAG